MLPVTSGLYQWFTGSSFGNRKPLLWDDLSGNKRDGVVVGASPPLRTSQRLGWGARDTVFVYAPSNAAVVFAGVDTVGASAGSLEACPQAFTAGGLYAEFFDLTVEAALVGGTVLSFWNAAPQFPSPAGRVPLAVRSVSPGRPDWESGFRAWGSTGANPLRL